VANKRFQQCDGLYVQYGCGFNAPDNWSNFDASPTLVFERIPLIGKLYTKNGSRFPPNVKYGDIVKGLPLAAGSCSTIYASHILEHLALEDCRTALANTYSILQSDGLFRLVVPDLEILARRYLRTKDAGAAVEFMRKTSLGTDRRPPGFTGLMKLWLGNSAHLWMWDFKGLKKELESVGFVNVRRCEFGDSSIALFRDVEDANRFVDSAAIECQKPKEK